MADIIGNFYYNRTVNGNLLGEFTNNLDDRIISESCNPRPNNVGFTGQYNSSWQQVTDTFGFTLTISPHPIPSAQLKFRLIWSNPNGTEEYFGDGFMVNDMLIGFYTNRRNLLRWG